MIVYPAVDILEGKAVRLLQGDPQRKSIFSHDPVEVAKRWHEIGAEWIHVVDLDGSLEGEPRNAGLIEEIVGRVGAYVQVGGGIRDLRTASQYLAMGVRRIVLGTIAVEAPEIVREACQRWPGQVAVALDARWGRVAVRGWKELTQEDALGFGLKMKALGAEIFVYTDVERDGMRQGLNIPGLLRLAKGLQAEVIAAGGVSSVDDIKMLKGIEGEGVTGVIIGKALYDGSVDLEEALRIARGEL